MISTVIPLESHLVVCLTDGLLHVLVEVVRDAVNHLEVLNIQLWSQDRRIRMPFYQLVVLLPCVEVGE
jgi:hypothetical protein